MKLNQNNKQERIIGTDDIFVSSNNSSLGNDLESLLLKLDRDILDLKRNVKWLYKYGGVGGSGGSGGTTVSGTKMSCTISYTDNNGNKMLRRIEDNAYYNILEGTSITVTCTITSNKSLNEYIFTLNNLKTTIKATDINGSITTTPGGNSVYTITLLGESTVSLNFTIFTKVTEVTHEIVLLDGITILGNFSIFKSLIESASYIFTLVNNLPDNFECSVNKVSINQVELNPDEYSIEESTNSLVNSKTLIVKVPLSKLFNIYDIYTIAVDYTFGVDSLLVLDLFIYLSDSAFVYCWSDTIDVYNKEVDNPNTSNNYNNVINYKIYPSKSDSLTLKYNLTINTGEDSSDLVVLAGTQYVYTVVNNVKETGTLKIPITFSLDGESYVYYIYLQKSLDVAYFFETDSGKKYYLAVSCDSENTNDNIITFPKKNPNVSGNPIIIDSELTTTLKTVSKNFGTLENDDLVSNFVQSLGSDKGTLRLDALFSFGLKYSGSNWSLPIVSILNKEGSETKELILYKNTLVFNNISQDICIPNDDNFHLVQLYFKSDYATSNPSGTININNTKLVVVLYIDGVQEIKPFEINSFFILANYTSIIYHPGLWQFNHIGVATFNGIPVSLITGKKLDCVAKYLLDLDPIIPSNYYQTYKTKVLNKPLTEKFDRTIYTSLAKNTSSKNGESQWLNYFNYNKDDNSHLNKFVNIDPSTIAKLAPSDMEIYCIVPESTNLGLLESGFDPVPDKHLNLFVYNTFKSYGENDKISKVACSFLKWIGKWVDVISNSENTDAPVLFYVKYLGSSTLLYSSKNFEVGINPILNLDAEELPVYFTPDVNLFPYMESSFNLKADIVDSSHSNNVVIGNFVNDYMVSPFNTTKKTYKSCLTGKPILLFIKNNAIDPTDNKTILDDSYIFLGIYSLNLNRGSVHNLGYSKLLDSAGNEIIPSANTITDDRCCDSITKFHILLQTEKEDFTNNFAVAEILDNGILYDYSLFDNSLLANQVLGDFYVSDNDRISKEYSQVFTKPFATLAKIIYNYIIKPGIFHTVDLKKTFKDYTALSTPQNYYYTNSDGEVISLPEDCITISSNDLNNLSKGVPYHENESYNGKKVALITNPLLQFHLICNKQGTPINNLGTTYYYLETLDTLTYDSENPDTRIDVEAAVKYYITCMAFAMVDSVLKNLTLKCPDTKNNNIWYPAFYDMDTAFGISNSGGNTSFLAFSDYVDSDGLIIQDYSPLHSSVLFDTPSSFLFMYAKYIDIITDKEMSKTTDGIFPFLEWSKLREIGGTFESGTKFCTKYIDDYFGDINPLIWNLNYAYKYFSETKNSNTSDNESKRFNGTRRFARKEYLNLRFKYLDVLFGFRNSNTIGCNDSFLITNGNTSIPNNSDIKINNAMFELFTKGVSGNINVEVREQPKTPIVLQVSASISLLYITDSSGNATITGNITSNTDCGFFGTTELTTVSECGQFLVNPTETNTINNLKILNINITSSPSTKEASIELDLNNLTSVDTITIGGSRRLYYNIITIKNSGNSAIKLSTLTLLNINCNTIRLSNFDVSGKLTVNNCLASSFIIDTLEAKLFVHTNNSFVTEQWQTFKNSQNLNIVNKSCTQLSILNTTLSSLVYAPSYNLSSLNLDSSKITSFTIKYSRAYNNISTKNSNISTFILNSDYNNENLAIPITALNLEFSNSTIELSIPGFTKVTTLSLGKVTNCTLLNKAFSDCRELLKLPANVIFTIKGNYIFRKANSLNTSDMLRCKLPSSNYTGLFLFNNIIDNDFVKNWFKTHSANSLDLLFCGCPKVALLYNVLDSSPSEDFTEFEQNFIESVSKTNNFLKDIVGTFYLTSVNCITKNIADTLVSKGVKTLNSVIGYNSANSNSFGSVLFIEKLALNKFISVNFTDYWIENSFLRCPVAVFDKDNGVITDSKISDYFDKNCTITTLSNFSPIMYNNSENSYGIEISLDFEDGFPSSMKSISMFKYISNINVKNMEKAFDNVSSCTLAKESFHNTSCTSNNTYDTYTDLFAMLFKVDSKGNVVPKVTVSFNINDADGTYMSFPKKISLGDLYKMLLYYADNKVTNISWLFRGATIYNCTDNHFLDYKLSSFNTLLYTFSYCTFLNEKEEELYLNILNIFKVEGKDTYTAISNLKHTFEKCALIKFTERLPILKVTSLNGTFTNCSFIQEETPTESIEVWKPSGIYSINVFADKSCLILPDNFFKICASACDLTNCFGCSGFSLSHLTGYLPDTDTLGLKTAFNSGAPLGGLFTNCNITFKSMEDQKYRFFPTWYNLLSFTNKYAVYIPFVTTKKDDKVYLFENHEQISGSYGSLPNLPDVNSGADYYYFRVTGSSANNNCLLLVAPKSSTFPILQGASTYKNMLPYRLALVLTMDSNTLVLTNMASLITSNQVIINSKPLIPNVEDLASRNYIFNGASIDKRVKNTVLP